MDRLAPPFEPSSRDRGRPRFLCFLLLAAALLLAACGGKRASAPRALVLPTAPPVPSAPPAQGTSAPPSVPATASVPAATSAAAPPALVPWETLSVDLGTGSISPPSLQLPAGIPVQVTVANNGDACFFSLSDFLLGLLVSRGRSATVTLVPPATSSSGAPAPSVMGCDGDSQRQGRVAIVAAPATPPSPTPGPGAAPAARVQISVTIERSGLQPTQVAVAPDTPLDLSVTNQSARPCLFSFAGYLRGLRLTADGAMTVTLTPPQNPPLQPAGAIMGCMGDPTRQGTVLAGEGGASPVPASSTPTAASPTPHPAVTPPPGAGLALTDAVIIANDHLQPAVVVEAAGAQVQLQVQNQSGSDCSFFISGVLDPQTVAAGQTLVVSFVAPSTPGLVNLGCVRDALRQGALQVVPAGP